MIVRALAMDTKPRTRRPLSVEEILRWADAHREATGKWPSKTSGSILGVRVETWYAVDVALRNGLHGLRGGRSLAQLLADERGVRNINNLPALSEELIRKWADQHHQRTGSWPGPTTPGIIPGTEGEKWKNLDAALRAGGRGLPGGSSLMQLLAECFGVRNRSAPPPLTIAQILAWADAYRERTGTWPAPTSGPIPDANGETWSAVAHALNSGSRGLPARSSLPTLFADQRGHRSTGHLPPLTESQILAWADQYHQRTRKWPNKRTLDTIPNAPGERWTNLDAALRTGTRGLRGGSSLALLLAKSRDYRNRRALPSLTKEQILSWADAYHRQHGCWPIKSAGRIARSGSETWSGVDQALRTGLRGLPGGTSLPRLLALARGCRHRFDELTPYRILRWADAHRARTGKWPSCCSGPVNGAPGESWSAIDRVLRRGGRGLSGGSSLICLLMEARQAEHRLHPTRLSASQVLAWADEYYRRNCRWPGPIPEPVLTGSPVTWRVVHDCLRRGLRGLPGGTTLARFLAKHRRAGP